MKAQRRWCWQRFASFVRTLLVEQVAPLLCCHVGTLSVLGCSKGYSIDRILLAEIISRKKKIGIITRCHRL